MALFCPMIRRDSVSLIVFPFRGHVQIISSAILLFWLLKSPYNFFSILFSCILYFYILFFMLVVMILAAVIGHCFFFLMQSSGSRIDESTLF